MAPSRKRTNLNSVSSKAKRGRLARQSESQSERDARLESNRERNALSLELEPSEQREQRLSLMREHTTQMRKQESDQAREQRLSLMRDHTTQMREQESDQARKQRLSLMREHTTHMREQESDQAREQRLSLMRDHTTQMREQESDQARKQRLSLMREHTTHMREQESDEAREQRLSNVCEHTTHMREQESDEAREQRLSNMREYTTHMREQESDEIREQRLSNMRGYTTHIREQESDEAREQRLSNMREHTALMREQESESEREERLTADRELHSLSLQNDTETQYAERLAANRVRYSLLSQEQVSYSYVNQQRVATFRASLSENYHIERLYSRRQVHALNIELELSVEGEHNSTVVEILNWVDKYKSGFSYNPNINYSKECEIGDMNVISRYCKALKWKNESIGLCCSSGKVHLEPIQPPPEPLKSLLNGDHPSSPQFLNSIRSYNSAFQMTSFGGNEISEGPFMPTFKIQGQVYHRMGSLLPVENAIAKFLQIYFISDYEIQTDTRMSHISNIDRNLVQALQTMLNEYNPYVKDFKTALQSLPAGNENDYKLVINADRRPATAHRGRYNEPTTNEVAVLLVNEQCDKRDIVLRTNDDRLIRICETHRSYDALQYPLLLCHGEDGYNFMVFNVDPVTREENNRKKTSALQFYCYRIMVRQDLYNHLHYYRKLFNQYLVDMYAKIETERLIFIRMNQKKLRSEEYVHLHDALRQDEDGENLGRLVILPSSFTGGPRYMHERTQDAFCYVRKYGRPDLFITITTNPKWNEIKKELLHGQAPYDRHDLISRVFHLKLKILINLLTNKKIFGAVRCFMYSVEWQKRGLPHAHLLLWLEEKIRPNEINRVVRAELPHPENDPQLHEIVKTHMIHGPCVTMNMQSPCMKNGRCSKRFPKQFTADTVTGEDGYPSYQRRNTEDGGFTALIRMRGQTIEVDNRWIVPYSPILSRTFQTHINVELCSSVQSIKYICKYVNKGSDQATFGIQNEHDEVLRYQSGRYVSTSEAVWRMLSFPVHERFPPVTHLAVHLENGQRVYFDSNNVRNRVEDPKNTTLMALFKLCQDDEFARTLLYEDVPSYYTFDRQRGVFNRRKRGSIVEGIPGVFKENTLGRVYTVHPNNSECYFLRLLLHHVRGPTCFDYLKSVDGVVHQTYQAACRALHLLEDDTNWDDTLREACISDNAAKLRQLFAVMLVFCNLSNPADLWEKYHDNFCEDIARVLQRRTPDLNVQDHRPEVDNRSLLHLQDFVISIGGNPLIQYGLPSPQATNDTVLNKEYAAEMSYNIAEISNFVQQNEPKLTLEQKNIYDRVVSSVKSKFGEIFFIDAPGGTGKTFLINLILANIRKDGEIALAVASSGIAATLLPGGKTAHSMFKIPIDLDRTENPVCGISKNSDKAKVLRDCILIVWDECTMANKKALEAVDRTLQDIRNNSRVMGGVTFLFSGDFRQTLPVITRGTRADEVNASLKRSLLWNHVKKLSLTTNMRAQLGGDSLARDFPDLLLKIGNGTMTEVNGEVQLPLSLCRTLPSVNELIAQVYPDIENLLRKDNSWLCERAILTPKNDEAAAINNTILSMFEAPEMVFKSINRVVNNDDATNYPIEFLNSLNAPGLPSHSITLKVGTPIMLLRNLSAPKLCNGTRLQVKTLQRNVIEASILTGCGRGEIVFIPRIPLIPNNFPFEFKRVQFPVSVCFAMTINKSQGQALRTAGVDLRTSCFSHGQLYVACSRVSSNNDLYICAPHNTTPNVVYKEALQ